MPANLRALRNLVRGVASTGPYVRRYSALPALQRAAVAMPPSMQPPATAGAGDQTTIYEQQSPAMPVTLGGGGSGGGDGGGTPPPPIRRPPSPIEIPDRWETYGGLDTGISGWTRPDWMTQRAAYGNRIATGGPGTVRPGITQIPSPQVALPPGWPYELPPGPRPGGKDLHPGVLGGIGGPGIIVRPPQPTSQVPPPRWR